MNRKYQFLALLVGAFMALINVSAFADRTPDWMVGTFEGTRPTDNRVITVRINGDGEMSATSVASRDNSRRSNRESVLYRRNLFTVGGFDYRVERSKNGFLAVATDRRNGEINFRRTGDYNNDSPDVRVPNDRPYVSDQRVPSWMVGTFEGTRSNDNRLVTVRINSDGAMSATVGENGRRTSRESISYRRDLLTIGGFDYRVERSRNGFTAIATDRRNSEINFRRIGDYVGDRTPQLSSRAPNWMVGHFDGRASRNGQIFNLRVTSDGRFTAKDRLHGEVANYFDVSYHRNILTIDGRDYRVERVNDGFRAIPINEEFDRNGRSRDKYGRIDFRRIEFDD